MVLSGGGLGCGTVLSSEGCGGGGGDMTHSLFIRTLLLLPNCHHSRYRASVVYISVVPDIS